MKRIASTLCRRLALVFVVLLTVGPAAHAQTFSVIHTFTGGGDGANPKAGVTYRGGALYGTASAGGTGAGTVYQTFKLVSNWFTLPISLLSAGGTTPLARVVFGPDGHPYGTTYTGGAIGFGTVFDLIAPLTVCKTANCFWKENVLHSFSDLDGGLPTYGDLTWDNDRNIYGTLTYGFNGGSSGGVFELQPSGTESVIYTFSGPDGATPENGVVFDPNSNYSVLYGTTLDGGLHSDGVVFKLTKFGAAWLETNAYNFQGAADGRYPYAGVVVDGSGNLFGATSDGGANGGGTVFELIPSGDTYTFKLLYSFTGQFGAACGPWASLTLDANTGDLYGTTKCDGANNAGNVFKLTKFGNSWTYSSLYDFTGGNDGANPVSNVTIGDDGNLYGTASTGGSQNVGVVWQIIP